MNNTTDVLIVGAGILGLAHAFEAQRRGLSVQIVEREADIVGASIRNFGHACLTAQAPEHDQRVVDSRAGWLAAAASAGFWAEEAGGLFVARTPAELALVDEFAQAKPEQVVLHTAAQVRARLGGGDPTILGGAFLPQDVRVDPRTAAPTLAAWLASVGVSVHWGTTVRSITDGVVHTSRGDLRAERVIVCVGHDLDHLYPATASAAGIQRCRLSMALVDAPASFTSATATLTGTSMLRYAGISALPAADAVRTELAERTPSLLGIGANVMVTRRPDGTLLVGDSHHYGAAAAPFLDEDVSDTLLKEVAGLLGVADLRVRQRWQGIYASSPSMEVLRDSPAAGVESVTVTTGIGMTLSFGLAAETFAG